MSNRHKGGVLFVWMAEKMTELQNESGKMVEWRSGVTRASALKELNCIQETAWIDSGDGNKFYCGVLYEE